MYIQCLLLKTGIIPLLVIIIGIVVHRGIFYSNYLLCILIGSLKNILLYVMVSNQYYTQYLLPLLPYLLACYYHLN